jgi:hypothetical protein
MSGERGEGTEMQGFIDGAQNQGGKPKNVEKGN